MSHIYINKNNTQVIKRYVNLSNGLTHGIVRELHTLYAIRDLPNLLQIKDYDFELHDDENIVNITTNIYAYDLQKFITKNNDRLPHMKTIFDQVINGLFYLRSYGIIHYDIRPSCIFMNNVNDVVIANFELSIQHDISDKYKDDVLYKKFLYFDPYRAPELNAGSDTKMAESIKNGHSYKTDIWALGVTMLEYINGNNIFENKDKYYVLELSGKKNNKKTINAFNNMLVRGNIKVNVENPYSNIIEKMLAIHPNDRITIEDIINQPLIIANNVPKRYDFDMNTRNIHIMVVWIITVMESFKTNLRNIINCIDMFERYISQQDIINDRLQLVAATCMNICSMATLGFIVIDDVYKMCKCKYSHDEIKKMQKYILLTLDNVIVNHEIDKFIDIINKQPRKIDSLINFYLFLFKKDKYNAILSYDDKVVYFSNFLIEENIKRK